jgi:hypothetical protein
VPDYICNCGGVIYRKGQRLICAKCQKDWGGVLYIGLFTDDPDKRGPLTKEAP